MCDICKDAGYYRMDVPQGDPMYGRVIMCACQQRRAARQIQERIGSRHDPGLLLGDVQIRGEGSRAMKAAAGKFLQKPHGFLTIYGGNGNGKTTCLQAMTNELLMQGVAALYVTCSDAVEFLKGGIKDASYDVEDRLAVLADIPAILMDEMSQPSWTEWVEDKLTTLINRRYAADLGTALALDEEPENFFHRRIYSRLTEGEIVRNGDPDMRISLGMLRREGGTDERMD